MHPHDRAVDHLDLAVMSLRDRRHQPVPDTGFAPTIETIIGGRVRPIALRQISPRRPRPQHPKDAIHDPSVILRLPAAAPLRQN